MSNVGMRILYGVMNQMEGVWCQRVFAPWGDMEEKMRDQQLPLWALESQEPVKDFDMIAFTIGYEMSYSNIVNMLRLSGVPIAAPSANISGKPSTTTAQHVFHDHNGKIDAIVDGGPCRVGVESTIVDLTDERPRLLRPGGITPEQLMEVLGDLVIDKAVTAQIDKDAVVKAPGMKYRHYAPQEPVVIVAGSREKAAQYIHRHFVPGDRVLCFQEELPLYRDCNPLAYGKEAEVETLSAGLFAALRELDDASIHQVYARCPVGGGVAYAVQNRLKKAAAFHIVDAEAEA